MMRAAAHMHLYKEEAKILVSSSSSKWHGYPFYHTLPIHGTRCDSIAIYSYPHIKGGERVTAITPYFYLILINCFL